MFQSNDASFWTWFGRAADLVGILGIPTLAIYYWQHSRRLFGQHKLDVNPIGANSGHKGLICSVSAPLPVSTLPSRQPEVIEKLIQDNDHPTDELLRTPIGPTLKALDLHQKDLIHCWLVASEDSTPYFATIEQASKKYYPRVTIHRVLVPDVYCNIDPVYEAVHNIFNSCATETQDKVQPRDIITDVTSGTKIMSIAMAVACLDADRKIQYIEQKEQKNFYKIDISWEKISKRPSKKEH